MASLAMRSSCVTQRPGAATSQLAAKRVPARAARLTSIVRASAVSAKNAAIAKEMAQGSIKDKNAELAINGELLGWRIALGAARAVPTRAIGGRARGGRLRRERHARPGVPPAQAFDAAADRRSPPALQPSASCPSTVSTRCVVARRGSAGAPRP